MCTAADNKHPAYARRTAVARYAIRRRNYRASGNNKHGGCDDRKIYFYGVHSVTSLLGRNSRRGGVV